jgi:PAS domain S-box-containing protein
MLVSPPPKTLNKPKDTSPVLDNEARLDAIVRSAVDAIITVDRKQRIVLFNAAAEQMFGCTAADAIGGPLDRFIPMRFRDRHSEHIERFARTGETSRRMGLHTTLLALRADGTEFPIEASISQALVGNDKLMTVVLRDISERVRAEGEVRQARDELHESEARLEAIVRSAMDAMITVDGEQRVVLFNAAAEKMFGCAAAKAIGAPLDQFIPSRFRAAHRTHIERFVRTGETSRRMGVQTALSALRSDGAEFPIEASISHASVGGKRLLTVILRDVTERVEAEQQLQTAHDELRELSLSMLEVREAERTRIARELHDDLGQTLTALKMDADLLEATIPPNRTDLLERVAAMRVLLDSTVTTTRRISSDLRPLVLDDLGLGAAAEWLVQSTSQRYGVACDLRIDPSVAQLGEPHASALFRIMQESLTNVMRHARATRVQVQIERTEQALLLKISDDGIGMEPEARKKPKSFGLRGINERVLSLGGELDISSHPGAGTMLVARIPVCGIAAKEST